ncbi:hypothetical protein SAMN05216327_10241 [Dyadobacter sp. SG02]|uniref:hypothetical protein n=1 Tax=Dyadobacter sp. SG02 TaxID=1855291 RepID=UPI0008ACB4EE|nr:hypothetical protein [Dyadobacter sp. SG02]SEI49782.1 hypothetical protein SAMN05216327_10241 [Dyadobacter sp. SG02]
MEESLKTRLILAARTGRLTEEEYELYLQLLEEDPDFREQAEWQDFLEESLPIARDAALYAAAKNYSYTERKPFYSKHRYAIAAGIAVLLVAGLGLYFGLSPATPEMVAARKIDLYSGDNKPEGQLGYAEGDMPADEVSLKWWKSPDQESRISYLLCADTLNVYFREPADTVTFNATYKLTYFTKTQEYQLESKDKKKIPLENCSAEPKPLLP